MIEDIETEMTLPEFRDYLDMAIRNWRKCWSDHIASENYRAAEMAGFYIDAYQSVRATLFNETLPNNV